MTPSFQKEGELPRQLNLDGIPAGEDDPHLIVQLTPCRIRKDGDGSVVACGLTDDSIGNSAGRPEDGVVISASDYERLLAQNP